MSQPKKGCNYNEGPQERHVFPQTHGHMQLVWYYNLEGDSQCLVILLKEGTILDGMQNILFEGSYEDLNNDQTISWSSHSNIRVY